MYWATVILFVAPCWLLILAWRRLVRSGNLLKLPTWRKHVIRAALAAGWLATVLHFVWNVSWLYNGGSPHGLSPESGIWRPLGPILVWIFALATLLGVLFAKGLSRLFFAGWSLSMCAVFQLIYVLQFD